MIKQWCIRCGLWLARLGGWQEPVRPEPEVRIIERQVEVFVPVEVEFTADELLREAQTSVLPTVPEDIQRATTRLIADAHRRGPERSGESKRAQVYWQLINAYPTVSKRVLSVAIEEAVCSAL